jgi:hypothetical protein
MVYVGVDLHRKRSHVVALDAAGEVVVSPVVAASTAARFGAGKLGHPGVLPLLPHALEERVAEHAVRLGRSV